MKQIHINLATALVEKLEQEAKAKGLTLNGYIRMLLIERGK